VGRSDDLDISSPPGWHTVLRWSPRGGPRPSALTASADGSRLYVALAGSDRIAVIDTHNKKVLRYLQDEAPGAPSEGSTPDAMALSADGSKLFVAEADNNAIAVFDVSERGEVNSAQKRTSRLLGRIPTDWYPTGVLDRDRQLFVLSGKGHGSQANPDGPTPGKDITRPLGYDLGQLNGTLRILPSEIDREQFRQYSRRVAEANGWGQHRSQKHYPPFKHVVYIIKENRTYDQVLGDLKEGDGDPSLVFFGREVSPNHHALGLRFGLFDHFFTNAEVSSQGHIWSTAAYVTDYGEKTIRIAVQTWTVRKPMSQSAVFCGISRLKRESGFATTVRWSVGLKAGRLRSAICVLT
jgi:hypothetical protein